MKQHVRYPSGKQCSDAINDSYKCILNRLEKKKDRGPVSLKVDGFEHPVEVIHEKMTTRQDSFCRGNTCLTNLKYFSERLNKHVDKRKKQSKQSVLVSEKYSTRSLTNKTWRK